MPILDPTGRTRCPELSMPRFGLLQAIPRTEPQPGPPMLGEACPRPALLRGLARPAWLPPAFGVECAQEVQIRLLILTEGLRFASLINERRNTQGHGGHRNHSACLNGPVQREMVSLNPPPPPCI